MGVSLIAVRIFCLSEEGQYLSKRVSVELNKPAEVKIWALSEGKAYNPLSLIQMEGKGLEEAENELEEVSVMVVPSHSIGFSKEQTLSWATAVD